MSQQQEETGIPGQLCSEKFYPSDWKFCEDKNYECLLKTVCRHWVRMIVSSLTQTFVGTR